MFTLVGADMSQASATSASTDVRYMDNIGIVVNWTGTTPVGVLTINASNDKATWIPLNFGATISISGNTGSLDIAINQLPYAHIQAVYTKTSGVGTIFAQLTAKTVGG